MQAAPLPIHSPPRADRPMPSDSNTSGSEESDQKDAFQDVLSAEESDTEEVRDPDTTRSPDPDEDTATSKRNATDAAPDDDARSPDKYSGNSAKSAEELPVGPVGHAGAGPASTENDPKATADPVAHMGTKSWPLRNGMYVPVVGPLQKPASDLSGRAAATEQIATEAESAKATRDAEALLKSKAGQVDIGTRPAASLVEKTGSALGQDGKTMSGRLLDQSASTGKLPVGEDFETKPATQQAATQSNGQFRPATEASSPVKASQVAGGENLAEDTASLRSNSGSSESASVAAAKLHAASATTNPTAAQVSQAGVVPSVDTGAATALGGSDSGESGRASETDALATTVSGSERSEAARSAQLRPELMRPDTARAVGRQMIEQVQAGRNGSFEISLNPEELGRIRMTLTPSEQGLHLSLSGERSETLDLLRRHISELQQDFADLGYGDISFEFSDSDGTDSGGEGQSFAQTGADTPNGSAQLAEAQSTGAAAQAGLDLRL